jgi:hypothetical protein
MIFEDNGIDGTTSLGELVWIDGKVIAKELPQKRKEKHHNAPILHYKKNGQK